MMQPNRYDFENIQRQISDLAAEIEKLRAHEGLITAARCTTAAAQTINNDTVTIVDFGTVVFDTQSRVTTGAAWKFTARVGGYYSVSATVIFALSAGWEAGEEADLYIYKNGVEYSRLFRLDNIAANTRACLTGSDLVYLAATDYLDIRVYQNSDGAIALHNVAVLNHVAVWKVEA